MTEALTLEKGTNSQAAFMPAGGFTYMPFLDGLRAISILLVMGFHQLGPATFMLGHHLNGWAGVDLFFIISGFLISSILLKEQDRDGSFSLKNFYVRRWLRICPAYYVFLAVMFGFMLMRGLHDYPAFAVAGLYLTNIDIAFGLGFLPARTGLVHTWSLSVEEQFYLLWPATLKFIKGREMPVCLSIIAAVYCWRLFLVSAGVPWMRLSAGLDTKLDSIMLGVLVALLWRKPNVSAFLKTKLGDIKVQLAVGALLLVSLHFLGHPQSSEQTEQALFWSVKMPATLLLMTALLVALLANPNSAFGKLLGSKPMVFVGRLSYSLYLWHILVNFPETNAIFETVGQHRKYLVEFLKYAACFGAASASYYLIEMPFLKLKSKFS